MRLTGPLRTIVLGFLAGAIAVVIAHQVMVLILYLLGQVPNFPWSFRPTPFGVPAILNQMFWGGVWGIAFAFVLPYLAALPTWGQGLVLGVGGNVVLGNWLLLPLVFGRGQVFAGWVPPRMLIGALIGGAFGVGYAYVHQLLSSRIR